MTEERWLPVPGWEGLYEVSDRGRVRSLPRTETYRGSHRAGGILNPWTDANGYLRVDLTHRGRIRRWKLHQLVAEVFLGPCPEGLEVCHDNGIKSDCWVGNLGYGTRAKNMRDKRRHGADPNVNKTHCPADHEYTPENTYVNPKSGRRTCRACMKESQARYRIKHLESRRRKDRERKYQEYWRKKGGTA